MSRWGRKIWFEKRVAVFMGTLERLRPIKKIIIIVANGALGGGNSKSDGAAFRCDINTDNGVFGIFLHAGPGIKGLVLGRAEPCIFLMLYSRN